MMILTITTVPVFDNIDYKDRVLCNIHSGDCEVFYSGQNQGRMDNQLTEAVANHDTFRVYHRRNNKVDYIFLGETNLSDIVHYRKTAIGENTSEEERLQIHLYFPFNKIINRQLATTYNGAGKFKREIFRQEGLSMTNNVNIGFYQSPVSQQNG